MNALHCDSKLVIDFVQEVEASVDNAPIFVDFDDKDRSFRHRQRRRSTTEKTVTTFKLLSYILYHIIKILYEQNWLQFLFAVKATALKLLPKFYPQFLSTEASYHMYATQWPVVNVEANFNFCA